MAVSGGCVKSVGKIKIGSLQFSLETCAALILKNRAWQGGDCQMLHAADLLAKQP
jgi:hypothetical protein